jgi:hypothetical protein
VHVYWLMNSPTMTVGGFNTIKLIIFKLGITLIIMMIMMQPSNYTFKLSVLNILGPLDYFDVALTEDDPC